MIAAGDCGKLTHLPPSRQGFATIGYVTLGTSDMSGAAVFHDALPGELGAGRSMETKRHIFRGPSMRRPSRRLIERLDGQPAVIASAKVDRLHAQALALGGSDEVAPGGPEGCKLNVFCMG